MCVDGWMDGWMDKSRYNDNIFRICNVNRSCQGRSISGHRVVITINDRQYLNQNYSARIGFVCLCVCCFACVFVFCVSLCVCVYVCVVGCG